MLSVSSSGKVTVNDASVPVTLQLPQAVNQTWTDTDDFHLPACNLYSGSGVELADGSRLALLTNVRWKRCAANASVQGPCFAVVAIVTQDGGRMWQYRATVSEADDEAFVTKLEDGRLLSIMRHNFGAKQP